MLLGRRQNGKKNGNRRFKAPALKCHARFMCPGQVRVVFLLFCIEKDVHKTRNRPKSEKEREMEQGHSGSTHPVQLFRPQPQRRNTNVLAAWASGLFAFAAIPTALTGIAAFAMGFGRFAWSSSSR
jgi:hypothetical protein